MSQADSDPMPSTSEHPTLAIATRLHLGHASQPPPSQQLAETLSNFSKLASSVNADIAVVAVDAEDKIEGYSLVAEVERICQRVNEQINDGHQGTNNRQQQSCRIHVLPVQPWGKFIPALNAIVAYTARQDAQCLLFASAEVGIQGGVMERMWSKLNLEDTLVVGAALQGHHHHTPTPPSNEMEVELTGRTCPWNTFALWNLPKLSLTGFLQVSEGLHDTTGEASAGIEEACTIATLQRILQQDTVKAKLVKIHPPAEVEWGQDFKNDEARREWHERKMQSKEVRAKRQLDLMGLSGVVIHC
ncbi:hypothetical protein ACHAW6_005400 [Cyclotella cf. meneghiniana]